MLVPKTTKLLVTTQPKYELDSASEIWHCLYVTGIPEDEIKVSFIHEKYKHVAGLIAISFKSEPLFVIERIRKYLQQHPWILRYTHRVIPIEIVTDDFNLFSQEISKLANNRISAGDSWRISISKHASKIKSKPIIEAIAKGIQKGKVSLTNYTWLINIEIIGDTYLGAVIRPYHIINRKEFFEKIKHTPVLEYYVQEPGE